MAKFTVEYNIHLGDRVCFTYLHEGHEEIQSGIVQDISQLPDVFVEGFSNNDNKYTRWRQSIRDLTVLYTEYDDMPKSHKVEFEKNEPVEFIHHGDIGTPDYGVLKYRTLGSQEFKNK